MNDVSAEERKNWRMDAMADLMGSDPYDLFGGAKRTGNRIRKLLTALEAAEDQRDGCGGGQKRKEHYE